MDIKQQINHLQQQINLRELSNDSYYLSQQYKKDCHTMYELRKLLKNPSKQETGDR